MRPALMHAEAGFESRVRQAGRTISVVDGWAPRRGVDGSKDRLVATMAGTMMTVGGRAGARA